MEKIYIIDDSRVFLKYFETTLVAHNYKIFTSKNPSEAFEEIKKIQPDCIITDFEMPELKGDQLTRLLKAEKTTKTIPIIILSALDQEKSVLQALSCGADDYLFKSTSELVILAKIKSMLRLKKLQDDQLKIERTNAIQEVIVRYNHEINNVLTILLNYQKKLKQILALEESQDLLSNIDNNYLRMIKLVNEMSEKTQFDKESYDGNISMIK